MQVKFGEATMTYPSPQLGELRDSNDLLGDGEALRQRMADDGYLLLRGLIDRAKVQRARETILEHMEQKQALVPGTPTLEGVMANGRTVPMLGRKGIAHHPDVMAVLESSELFDFYETLFSESSRTFDYKWLRGVGNEQFTGAHMDVVYMGRGSRRLHTCWVPFGDIDVPQGTLAMCVGSHRDPGFARIRETYGRMDVDRDGIEGWFSRDPQEIVDRFGGQWKTTHYRMGDVITFGMYTMHASTTNTTNRFRLSCDVRFQPASEPADHRWVGDNSVGHEAPAREITPIAQARAAWGV